MFGTGGNRHRRSFTFAEPKGVSNENTVLAKDAPRRTTVKLIAMREEFQKTCPKRLDVIARKIMEHSLVHLLTPTCPHVVLHDEHSGEDIDINQMFRDEVSQKADERGFALKGNGFTVRTFRLYRSDDPRHRMHLCAQTREVTTDQLNTFIPDLTKKLTDEDGKSFVVASYVSGELLDTYVNQERTEFDLPEDEEGLLPNAVSKEEIRQNAAKQVAQVIAPQLESVSTEKRDQIRTYVDTKAPQYRYILKHRPEVVAQIPAGLSEDRLDAALHKAQYEAEAGLRQRAQTIMNAGDDDLVLGDESMRKFVEEENSLGAAKLAAYVAHRKVVIDLLGKQLGLDEVGKRPPEEAVHELIFPLRSTSDDVPLEQQNLWLIDERLSYHRYLASDTRLDSMEVVESEEDERPDIVIFNGPFAFVETEPPFQSVVIIEFKRPMRKDLAQEKKNPIKQSLGYVQKIKEGKAVDRNGAHVQVHPATPFYVYIICDITPTVTALANEYDLEPTPDHLGFFGYRKAYGAYMEIISYKKLIADAKKRNHILFDKLNIL